MKKIIAASASLLLAGSMVSTASAAVTFTGDARERLILERDYNFHDQTNDFNTGRVRLVVNAESKGGAYANVRMRFADGTYDGTRQTGITGDGTGHNYYTDWAYLGIPVGPITIKAGLMPENDPQAIFFRWDQRFDRIAATYENKMTAVTAMYSKIREFTDPTTTTTTTIFPAGGTTGPLEGSSVTHVGTDTIDDNDINEYGAILKQKFYGDWNLMAIGLYQEDQRDVVKDTSGFMGFANVKGSAGPVKVGADFSYKDKKVLGSEDNGWGGTLNGRMSFGPAEATLIIGQTKNGFAADGHYGFLMIGGAMDGTNPDIPIAGSPIQLISQVGLGGDKKAYDTFFAGFIGDYKVSDMVKLVGILAYADLENYAKLTEISGLVRFDVTDGAYIDLGAGWLKPSSVKLAGLDDKAAAGAFTELGIKF